MENWVKVIAMNEPRGEGNGWEPCADNAPGVLFYLEDTSTGELFDGYRTRAEAEKHLSEREA